MRHRHKTNPDYGTKRRKRAAVQRAAKRRRALISAVDAYRDSPPIGASRRKKPTGKLIAAWRPVPISRPLTGPAHRRPRSAAAGLGLLLLPLAALLATVAGMEADRLVHDRHALYDIDTQPILIARSRPAPVATAVRLAAQSIKPAAPANRPEPAVPPERPLPLAPKDVIAALGAADAAGRALPLAARPHHGDAAPKSRGSVRLALAAAGDGEFGLELQPPPPREPIPRIAALTPPMDDNFDDTIDDRPMVPAAKGSDLSAAPGTDTPVFADKPAPALPVAAMAVPPAADAIIIGPSTTNALGLATCKATGLFAAAKQFAPITNMSAPVADPAAFSARLVAAAKAQVGDMTIYNARYVPLAYPLGDVSAAYGVCSDVVVRAYRRLGFDLQELVYRSRLGRGDVSIDHRRTEVLRKFFEKYGEALQISEFAEDYRPGDIVTYYRPKGITSKSHIAIVSDEIAPSGRPYLLHNRGWGVQSEDALFSDKITGHYRFTHVRLQPRPENADATAKPAAVPLPLRPAPSPLAKRRRKATPWRARSYLAATKRQPGVPAKSLAAATKPSGIAEPKRRISLCTAAQPAAVKARIAHLCSPAAQRAMGLGGPK